MAPGFEGPRPRSPWLQPLLRHSTCHKARLPQSPRLEKQRVRCIPDIASCCVESAPRVPARNAFRRLSWNSAYLSVGCFEIFGRELGSSFREAERIHLKCQ